ncbi:MAG: alpha-L-arabinofuranosidase, partial [Verrucomicrobiota bacterium]
MPFCRLHLPGFAALLLAVLLPHLQAQPVAEPDYLIYTDSLVNSWQNFSFKTVTASVTNPVHSGTNALSVTTTGSFGALYVHIAGFDTTTYGSISFWINGGPTGGQLLQVFGVLKVNGTDTQQTSVTFSAPAANTWKQVTIPLSSLGVANKSNLTGFWIQNRVSTVQPLYYVDDIRLVAAAPPSSVSIAVNTAATVRTADARIFGVNTAIWDSRLNTTTTATLLTETGLHTLRYPGGSNSDSYHWATNKSDGNTWSWATNFDNFAQLAANSGSTAVYITVNYGSGTPAEAADWVTYSNVTKGYHMRYWEVGNEIYGSWENDTNSVPHDPFTYATRFKDYYNQMKARDPSIKIGAVVEVGEDAYANNTSHPATNPRTGVVHNGWTPVMLATLKSLGVTPDFAIHHRYPPNLGDAGLLQQATTWAADTANLRQQLNDYLGTSTASAVELVCTETNGPITNN